MGGECGVHMFRVVPKERRQKTPKTGPLLSQPREEGGVKRVEEEGRGGTGT